MATNYSHSTLPYITANGNDRPAKILPPSTTDVGIDIRATVQKKNELLGTDSLKYCTDPANDQLMAMDRIVICILSDTFLSRVYCR